MGPSRSAGRLPDFIIIGAMKSGTTTLFRWLESHPETAMPTVKEPGFFCDERQFRDGLTSYKRLFPAPGVTGEASVAYSDPFYASLVAGRLRRLHPNVKLIFLAREPVARLRSHYLHECLRGRERRPIREASAPGSPYVRRSCYRAAIAPYMELLPSQLLVVRTESLDGGTAWTQIQKHLGFSIRPQPEDRHNVSQERSRETKTMNYLKESGVLPRLARVPKPIRRLGKAVVFRRDSRYAAMLAESQYGDIHPDARELIGSDMAGFRALLDWTNDPW